MVGNDSPQDEPMLLKRYGDYVILAGLTGFGVIAYLAVFHGFSILLLLMVFYAVVTTAAGVGMRIAGRRTL